MIAVVNVSTHNQPTGWHDYEVRINAKVIAKFRHRREEGLTKCLECAAKATEDVLTRIDELVGEAYERGHDHGSNNARIGTHQSPVSIDRGWGEVAEKLKTV